MLTDTRNPLLFPDRASISIAVVLCLALLFGGCITTNIQSGATHPPPDGRERFFQPSDNREETYRAAEDPALAEEVPLTAATAGNARTTPVRDRDSGEGEATKEKSAREKEHTDSRSATNHVQKEHDPLHLFGEEREDRQDAKSDLPFGGEKSARREDDRYFVDDGDQSMVASPRKGESATAGNGRESLRSEGDTRIPATAVAPVATGGDEVRNRSDESLFSSGSGEYRQVGTASWYGKDFDGRRTANGEIFNSRRLSAAHRTLPLGTVILVRNMENKKELVVRINDRGPYVRGRILDISEYGAEKLDFKEQGLTTVGIKVLRLGEGKAKNQGATKTYYARLYPEDQKELEREERENFEKPLRPTGTANSNSAVEQKKADDHFPNEEILKGYSVQLGVFARPDNALILKKAMANHQVPVYVLKRGIFYVVKAGDYPDIDRARDLCDRLHSEGFAAFVSEP